MSSPTTIFVCITCQRPDVTLRAGDSRSGEILFKMLSEAGSAHRIEAVPCMNNCLQGCTVGFSGEHKWTYVFGKVDPLEHAADVIALADVHASLPDGQVNWGRRPESLKRNSISRIPPLFPPKAA
jgi:predicted metal-binding protein